MAAAAAIKEPESGSMRQFRSLERAAMNSEPFPPYAEPLVASEEQIEELLNSQPRQSPGSKLDGNVDPQTLHESGLLWSLPEFLGQLARVDLDKETVLANSPALAPVKVEDKMDVDMDDIPDLIETQKRRRARRVILPGGRPFKLPGDDDDRSDVTSEDMRSRQSSISDDDSGNGTDTSSSTVASLRVNLKKRKAAQMSGDTVETELPGKIRLHKNYIDEVVVYYDKESNTLRRKRNPLFDAQREMPAMPVFKPDSTILPVSAPESAPAGSGSDADDRAQASGNSSPRMKPIRVIRISAPVSFNPGSPTEDRKVIVLKVQGTPSPSFSSSGQTSPISLNTSNDTRHSSPASESSPSSSSSSSGVKRIVVLPPGSRANSKDREAIAKDDPRQPSPAAASSASSRKTRIIVLPPGSRCNSKNRDAINNDDSRRPSPAASSSSSRKRRIVVLPPGSRAGRSNRNTSRQPSPAAASEPALSSASRVKNIVVLPPGSWAGRSNRSRREATTTAARRHTYSCNLSSYFSIRSNNNVPDLTTGPTASSAVSEVVSSASSASWASSDRKAGRVRLLNRAAVGKSVYVATRQQQVSYERVEAYLKGLTI